MQFLLDRFFLRLPIFGPIIRKSVIARWTRTLATMFAAGVPLVESLDSVGGAAGNSLYKDATDKIQTEVATGTSLMADDRAIVSEAYAGDIIGLFDPGIFSIGDTLCTGKKHVQFAGIPTFAPEHFARVTQVDTMKRKQFVKGMEQIAQEGAIQIFRDLGAGMEEVIVGVVGVLQLEVLEYRLKNEYNVDIRMQTLPYEHLRWVLNDPEELDIKHLDVTSDTRAIEDMKGNPLLLFGSPWSINWAEQHNEALKLSEFGNLTF